MLTLPFDYKNFKHLATLKDTDANRLIRKNRITARQKGDECVCVPETVGIFLSI